MAHHYIDIINKEHAGTILLNRPEARNALNPLMITELISAVRILVADPALRVMVVRGKNATFSSGADLKWLRESGSKTFEENLTENRVLSELMEILQQVPVPLISVVEGPAFGGALGILGCSDWVLAEQSAVFAFPEVKLGLAPAIIMPYVLWRTGSLKIRQKMLTGEPFDAWEALDAGLVDHTGERPVIENTLGNLIRTFSGLPGNAVREVKRLWSVSKPAITKEIAQISLKSLAGLKQSPEAQLLLKEFFNKQG